MESLGSQLLSRSFKGYNGNTKRDAEERGKATAERMSLEEIRGAEGTKLDK